MTRELSRNLLALTRVVIWESFLCYCVSKLPLSQWLERFLFLDNTVWLIIDYADKLWHYKWSLNHYFRTKAAAAAVRFNINLILRLMFFHRTTFILDQSNLIYLSKCHSPCESCSITWNLNGQNNLKQNAQVNTEDWNHWKNRTFCSYVFSFSFQYY